MERYCRGQNRSNGGACTCTIRSTIRSGRQGNHAKNLSEIKRNDGGGNKLFRRAAEEPAGEVSKGTFGCKSAPYYTCSICATFSVARFIVSGDYYRSSFKSGIELIVR